MTDHTLTHNEGDDPVTIDPNATLRALRHTTNPGRATYAPAATHARALLAHLDAGGALPDAWQPFVAGRNSTQQARPADRNIPDLPADPDDPRAAADALDWQGAIETYDISRECDDWSALPAIICGIADRFRDLADRYDQGRADPRSVAGTVRQTIHDYRRTSRDVDVAADWPEGMEQHIDAADHLANAAAALLEHLETDDNDDDNPREIGGGDVQWWHDTAQHASRQWTDAARERDAWRRRAQDAENQCSQMTAEMDTLRAELQNVRRHAADIHQARNRAEADMLREQRDTAQRQRDGAINATAAALAERDAARAHTNPNRAYATIARRAANLAEQTIGTTTGTYRDIKQQADDNIAHATINSTNEGACRVTIAAMLAVGAARFDARRKDNDLAERTAAYLTSLADQLDSTT